MPAEACYFLTWPFDFNIMIGFVGGQFGWDVSDRGEEAAVDFALNELVKMLGATVRKHFVKGHLTGWANNPLTRGAYAAASPGHHKARSDLGKSLNEKLFFAGEAVGVPYMQLCSGAYNSGVNAANEVIASV